MPDGTPLTWSVYELTAAYRSGDLSPVEVARAALERIERLDPQLHAFVTVDPAMTAGQAEASALRYRNGEDLPLDGVPVSIKDAFRVRGLPTTLGSLVHRDDVAAEDSGVVRRLRRAGAVFTGTTNTAEFGQSATTDNLLGPDTANPWDPRRTPGGSSGGAAASVAAGMSTLAVGSDGGGSIRIPAAFCGLVGVKPSHGRCPDEGGFRAMTDFVCPGPLARRAADARAMLAVLADRRLPRRATPPLVVGYCARPEGRPVDPGVVTATDHAVAVLERLGHHVVTLDLAIEGWADVFGPLVLDDERRERSHLLDRPDLLTHYVRRGLEAASTLDPAMAQRAREALPLYRQRIADIFVDVDVIVTPTTAVPAFELGHRPRTIDGTAVDGLWGAFPFAVPFNVAGTPAATIPSGLVGGLPVGVHLVTPMHTDALLVDLAEDLDEAIGFDHLAPARCNDTTAGEP